MATTTYTLAFRTYIKQESDLIDHILMFDVGAAQSRIRELLKLGIDHVETTPILFSPIFPTHDARNIRAKKTKSGDVFDYKKSDPYESHRTKVYLKPGWMSDSKVIGILSKLPEDCHVEYLKIALILGLAIDTCSISISKQTQEVTKTIEIEVTSEAIPESKSNVREIRPVAAEIQHEIEGIPSELGSASFKTSDPFISKGSKAAELGMGNLFGFKG